MEENIINFKNYIQKVISRFVKEIIVETKNKDITYKCVLKNIIKHINNLPFDEVIDDVINIIINEGKYNINALINDANAFINHKTTKISHNYKMICDKQDLIIFFKLRMNNVDLITDPIMQLFVWSRTLRGSFYSNLSSRVYDRLSYIDIYKMVRNAVDYYG